MDRKLGVVSIFGEGELGPPCQVYSSVIEPFGHNTPTLQTDRTDNGQIAQGELYYKRSPKNIEI